MSGEVYSDGWKLISDPSLRKSAPRCVLIQAKMGEYGAIMPETMMQNIDCGAAPASEEQWTANTCGWEAVGSFECSVKYNAYRAEAGLFAR
jgi:hypothetical protein